MRNRPVVRVGELLIHGETFRFVPPASERVTVRGGEEAEVVLTYRYEEATARKEECSIRFDVELAGMPPGRYDVRATDTPGVPDEQRGSLRHVLRGLSPGLHRGRFRIEGVATSSGWAGGQKQSRRFQHEGEFVVEAA